MFAYVHHVHYVVQDRDATVDFLEKTFGMKPVSVHHNKKDNENEALYEVDKTQIQIVQPLDPSSTQGKFLATHGPGLFHVGWGVDNIQKLAQELTAKGCKTIHHEKPTPNFKVNTSSHGYLNFALDPTTTHGVFCHICGPRGSK